MSASLRRIRWRHFGARPGRCPACGLTLFVRFDETEWSVRCVRCESTPAVLGIVEVLRAEVSGLESLRCYELSSSGPLVGYLRRRGVDLTCSELFDGVEPGELRDGVRCEDVQSLTFGDQEFDLCTSTEVFEHVADDRRGFAEIARVLRPGGLFVFTVPLDAGQPTVERARLVDGRVEHLLEPEYHDDRLRGRGRVLCFRNYGRDIVDRLLDSGFASARIVQGRRYLGFARPVVVGRVSS